MVTIPGAAGTMRLPVLDARGVSLEKRSKTRKSFIVIGVIVAAIFAILIITWLLTYRNRNKNRLRNAKSESKLPSIFSWQGFSKRLRRNEYSNTLQDNELDRSSTQDREMSGAGSADPERQSTVRNSGVDRNTSVRSVMTLPSYSPAVRENERVLGREGERAGMDSVVEFPENHDEEEARREEEMESLYQIRVARRQEARDREERRTARREARARGDHEALAEIRRRAEQAAEESVSQMLIAEHQGANRERRVSSVQYGELGVARHDGTRLRANSTESDNRPLLDSAASISGRSGRSRAASGATSQNTLITHNRGLSVSSMHSAESPRASEEFEFTDAVRTRSNATSNDDFEVVDLSHPASRVASHNATPLGTPSLDIPREEAPAYEDPPIYESPVSTRAPQLPQLPHLERLPSIQVTAEPSPSDPRPLSPPR